MDWFFAESVDGEHLITGEDAIHITKSLRKSVGEAVTLCDSSGVEHNCLIDRINDEGVFVHEISKTECRNEPSVEVTLFAALTKGDKLETVIQKSVAIFFFEGGGKSLKEILSSPAKKIAIFTGPEGGFEEREVELLAENGALVATLGKRILRAETAPIVALAAIMFETGNLE